MSRPDFDLAALEADPRVFWTRDVLRFRDTDANGHVNNAVFSTFCETGRVRYLRDVMQAGAPGVFYVIARLAIDFRGELHYPGEVRCGTWVPSLGRSSLAYEQALFDGSGRLVAHTEAIVVQLDSATRRPTPFGDDIRARIEPMLRPPEQGRRM